MKNKKVLLIQIMLLLSIGGCASDDPVYISPVGPGFGPPPPGPLFGTPGGPGFGPPQPGPGFAPPPPGP